MIAAGIPGDRYPPHTPDEIHAGLTDVIKHAKGKKSKLIEHTPEEINVKAIREKTGMSQQRFCAAFGISLGTLRHWEQGLRSPRGAARVLLKVVQKNPKAVIKAI
jgi:putative transcriptional regulator